MEYPAKTPDSAQKLTERVFSGDGELARLCRTKDWSATPLSAMDSWTASLRAAAGLVIGSPTPMVVLWGQDLIQIYNDSYRAVMGNKHPDGLGQPTRECWPEVWSFNAPLYEGVMYRRESFTFEDQPLVIERHGHREEAFFTLTYSPVLDDSGEVGGVLVVVHETTAKVERARVDQARRESEERYQLALEAADLGAWDLDLLTDTTSSRSLRHDQMFGYRELQAEWGREVATRHVLPEDRETFRQAFARAAETGVMSCEVRVKWPDGSIHWIAPLGRIYYDDQGRPVRMAGVVADITERVYLGALRESEERFRLMADALPQIIWVIDAQGKTEFVNRHWSRYTGEDTRPDTVRGIAESIFHPDDAEAVTARFAKAREDGSTFLSEHRIRSARGEYRWFLATGEPSRDPVSGEIVRWIGISVDIHDRKLAEATLRQAAELNAFRVSLENVLRPLADPGNPGRRRRSARQRAQGEPRLLCGSWRRHEVCQGPCRLLRWARQCLRHL
ncbi:PAS domain S-box protein [Proteobacteria bacterium 005FR1]|nr:PAS domain S-box protein [Proteobacteria bacterium 005FR1]